jgi:hypothetical protein
MHTLIKTLIVASTLLTGTVAAMSLAMAGSDGAYHWGYPDSLKNSAAVPAQPFGGQSGIPAQYR